MNITRLAVFFLFLVFLGNFSGRGASDPACPDCGSPFCFDVKGEVTEEILDEEQIGVTEDWWHFDECIAICHGVDQDGVIYDYPCPGLQYVHYGIVEYKVTVLAWYVLICADAPGCTCPNKGTFRCEETKVKTVHRLEKLYEGPCTPGISV